MSGSSSVFFRRCTFLTRSRTSCLRARVSSRSCPPLLGGLERDGPPPHRPMRQQLREPLGVLHVAQRHLEESQRHHFVICLDFRTFCRSDVARHRLASRAAIPARDVRSEFVGGVDPPIAGSKANRPVPVDVVHPQRAGRCKPRSSTEVDDTSADLDAGPTGGAAYRPGTATGTRRGPGHPTRTWPKR